MATGALDANGIWQYGEDDSETTFSGLLNKLASSTSDTVTRLEGFTGYTGTLPISNGGTGSTTVSAAQTALRVGLVPISPTSTTFVGGTGSTNTLGQITFTTCIGIEVDGAFSSNYQNYLIQYWGTASASGNVVGLQVRTGTSNQQGLVYYYGGTFNRSNSATVFSWAGGGEARWPIGYTSTDSMHGQINIYEPNVSGRNATVAFAGLGYSSGAYSATQSTGIVQDTGANTGINLYVSAGTITGKLQIFGYND